MKALVLFLALQVMMRMPPPYQPVTPDEAATGANPTYPLHAHIFESIWHWDRTGTIVNGWGHGDLLGASPQGFDFIYYCNPPFRHNLSPGDYYQARWKKPNQKLELLLQSIGSSHEDRCTLSVTMKDRPYGSYALPPKTGAAQKPSAPQSR